MTETATPRTALQSQGRLGLWKVMSTVSIVATVATGLAYLGLQLAYHSYLEDPIFVIIVTLNTIVAAAFGFHFDDKLHGLLAAFNAMKDDAAPPIDPDQAFRNIFNNYAAVPYAIVHAGFVASWVYVLGQWAPIFSVTATPQDVMLDRLLGAFLFSGNLMIGYGIFCIVRFWLLSSRRIAAVKLNIFNPTRPDIALYQDITKRIVILVAVIATLAVISLRFSVIDYGTTTFLFSLSSLAVVIAVYLIPMLPLTARFQQTRYAELHRVELRMDALYEEMIASEDPGQYRGKLNEFVALREQVRKVKTLPPGGEFSVVTAVGVSAMTFLPTIIERLLKATADLVLDPATTTRVIDPAGAMMFFGP